MAERIGGIDPGEVAQAVTALKDQLVDAAQQASEKLEIEKRVQENPWMVLGIAAGAGFLLGGGLWPALRPLVKAAGRTAMSPSNLLAIAAAFGAMRAAQSSEGEEPGAETTPTAH
ncbi:MAG: glycine zipper domain-containing protein [Anaeromyxobacteraceae bacterium]